MNCIKCGSELMQTAGENQYVCKKCGNMHKLLIGSQIDDIIDTMQEIKERFMKDERNEVFTFMNAMHAKIRQMVEIKRLTC